MFDKKHNAVKSFTRALKDGEAIIEYGASLWTRKTIMLEQKTWSLKDNLKKFDFKIAPFWLFLRNTKPIKIYTISDLISKLNK